MENLTEFVKKTLDEMEGFIKNNHYNVIKVEKNYCEMDGIITSSSMNHLQTVHGGYIFGLADTAAGIASMTDGRKVVTVDASINYFKSAKGNKIKAVAKVLKNGKNLSVYDVLISDEADNLIAKATITYFFIDN